MTSSAFLIPLDVMQGGKTPIPLVTLRNVTKRFANGTLALSGLSLSIAPGSFVSLLGASGCGKSTVLKLIAGLTRPTQGTIGWPSDTKLTQSGRTELTSYVFQDPTLMPWATALENVRLPLDLSGVSAREGTDRAREALSNTGLGAFENAYPRQLSGGMKMRVSLARAIVTRPRLLLLDEPFAALDEITRFRLNDEISALWRAQRFTAIFVTHSVFESVYLSHRVIVMAARPGRVFSDLDVTIAGERDEAFRTSPAYVEMSRRTTEALKAAMSA